MVVTERLEIGGVTVLLGLSEGVAAVRFEIGGELREEIRVETLEEIPAVVAAIKATAEALGFSADSVPLSEPGLEPSEGEVSREQDLVRKVVMLGRETVSQRRALSAKLFDSSVSGVDTARLEATQQALEPLAIELEALWAKYPSMRRKKGDDVTALRRAVLPWASPSGTKVFLGLMDRVPLPSAVEVSRGRAIEGGKHALFVSKYLYDRVVLPHLEDVSHGTVYERAEFVRAHVESLSSRLAWGDCYMGEVPVQTGQMPIDLPESLSVTVNRRDVEGYSIKEENPGTRANLLLLLVDRPWWKDKVGVPAILTGLGMEETCETLRDADEDIPAWARERLSSLSPKEEVILHNELLEKKESERTALLEWARGVRYKLGELVEWKGLTKTKLGKFILDLPNALRLFFTAEFHRTIRQPRESYYLEVNDEIKAKLSVVSDDFDKAGSSVKFNERKLHDLSGAVTVLVSKKKANRGLDPQDEVELGNFQREVERIRAGLKQDTAERDELAIRVMLLKYMHTQISAFFANLSIRDERRNLARNVSGDDWLIDCIGWKRCKNILREMAGLQAFEPRQVSHAVRGSLWITAAREGKLEYDDVPSRGAIAASKAVGSVIEPTGPWMRGSVQAQDSESREILRSFFSYINAKELHSFLARERENMEKLLSDALRGDLEADGDIFAIELLEKGGLVEPLIQIRIFSELWKAYEDFKGWDRGTELRDMLEYWQSVLEEVKLEEVQAAIETGETQVEFVRVCAKYGVHPTNAVDTFVAKLGKDNLTLLERTFDFYSDADAALLGDAEEQVRKAESIEEADRKREEESEKRLLIDPRDEDPYSGKSLSHKLVRSTCRKREVRSIAESLPGDWLENSRRFVLRQSSGSSGNVRSFMEDDVFKLEELLSKSAGMSSLQYFCDTYPHAKRSNWHATKVGLLYCTANEQPRLNSSERDVFYWVTVPESWRIFRIGNLSFTGDSIHVFSDAWVVWSKASSRPVYVSGPSGISGLHPSVGLDPRERPEEIRKFVSALQDMGVFKKTAKWAESRGGMILENLEAQRDAVRSFLYDSHDDKLISSYYLTLENAQVDVLSVLFALFEGYDAVVFDKKLVVLNPKQRIEFENVEPVSRLNSIGKDPPVIGSPNNVLYDNFMSVVRDARFRGLPFDADSYPLVQEVDSELVTFPSPPANPIALLSDEEFDEKMKGGDDETVEREANNRAFLRAKYFNPWMVTNNAQFALGKSIATLHDHVNDKVFSNGSRHDPKKTVDVWLESIDLVREVAYAIADLAGYCGSMLGRPIRMAFLEMPTPRDPSMVRGDTEVKALAREVSQLWRYGSREHGSDAAGMLLRSIGKSVSDTRDGYTIPKKIPVMIKGQQVASGNIIANWMSEAEAYYIGIGNSATSVMALPPRPEGPMLPSSLRETYLSLGEIIGFARDNGITKLQFNARTWRTGFARIMEQAMGIEFREIVKNSVDVMLRVLSLLGWERCSYSVRTSMAFHDYRPKGSSSSATTDQSAHDIQDVIK